MRLTPLLTLAPLAAAALAQTADPLLDPDSLARPRPLEFEPPAIERVVMANGLTVFLLEDHELPLIEARVITRVGSIYEPAEQVGLASLTGTVMRTGGTTTVPGDALDEELESKAMVIETGIGTEMGTASLSCLREDVERGVELLADVLRHPAFPQEKIDLAVNQMREQIRRRNDDPQEIARREFRWLLYGQDNPWARLPSMATLDAIGREDLVAFHSAWYHPNNTMLGVAGDFERDAMLALIERHFGDWPAVPVEIPPPPPVPDTVQPGLHFIHRPDVNQSNIRLGHWGVPRHHPDEFPIKVMNFIYGASGFTSRLMREVRSNRGLTYGIGGLVGEDTVRGVFFVATFTKSESTADCIRVIEEVTRQFQAEPPTAEELALAKDSEANSFVFRFDQAISIVNERMVLEFHGYPEDYLATYLDKIQAVSAEDVQRAAQAHIDPDELVILVVGNQAELGDQLSSLGEVHPVPLIDFATGEQIWP